MTNVDVRDLKSLREALCVATHAIGQTYLPRQTEYAMGYIRILQELTDKIDILRPLGSDGKHGDLHTEFCGCVDNPYRSLLYSWRVIPEFPRYELTGLGNIRLADNPYISEYELSKEINARYDVLGNQELTYSLSRYEEDGHLHKYEVHVRKLRNDTFPELKRKED